MSQTPYRINMADGNLQVISDAGQLMEAGWSEYVHSHPEGNFFQLPEAYLLFKEVPGYTPLVFGILDKDSGKVCAILVAVIQKELSFYGRLTARVIVWGGPLCQSTEQAGCLLQYFDQQVSSKVIYAQFRNTFDCSGFLDTFKTYGFRYLDHLNYLVPVKVENPQTLLSNMSKSKVRQLKKGLTNAEIIEATRPEEAEDFYYLLRQLYEEKVNKPLPPKKFFDCFFTMIVSKGLGKYLLIKHEDKIIGGIMCPTMPGKAIYEWYVAGLDKEYKEEFPSILATWAAIAEGQKQGCLHFDFLGAGKPDADYGVREFKSKFGGILVNYGRFEKIYQPLLMKAGTFGLKLYKYIRR